jgi:hypothetical protein
MKKNNIEQGYFICGDFANLRKATVKFVMCVSAYLSVSMDQLGSHSKNFHEI